MGAYMKQPFGYSEDVKKPAMPVMLIYGDGDMITLDHAVSFYHLLGGRDGRTVVGQPGEKRRLTMRTLEGNAFHRQ
jgi:hypothetical protein